MERETFDQSKEFVSCPYVLILYESKDKDIYIYIDFRQLSKSIESECVSNTRFLVPYG